MASRTGGRACLLPLAFLLPVTCQALLHNRFFFKLPLGLEFLDASGDTGEEVMTEIALTIGILVPVMGKKHIAGLTPL